MPFETRMLLDWLTDTEKFAVAEMAQALQASGCGTARLDVLSDAGAVMAGRSVKVDLAALVMG